MARNGGSRLQQEYTILRLLGAGAFGTVIECSYNLDKKKYAIKVTPADGEDMALEEVEKFVSVPSHKNLVQYFTCWKDSLSQTALVAIQQTLGISSKAGHKLILPARNINLDIICIQMELCGEDLRKSISRNRNVNEQKAINIFVQLVKGVEHLHKHGVMHRDLKPENIFTSNGDSSLVKIGDLGIATFHNSAHSLDHSAGTGTRLYFAPEQEGNRYGKSIDIYALGIIFLELLHPSTQPSFNGGSFQLLIEMVTALKFMQLIPPPVKNKWPIASNMILRMTCVNSEQRPNALEIISTFLDNGKGKPNLLAVQTNPQAKHFGISCKGCGNIDFEGVRYKCNICADYDLCEGCEVRRGIHPESHPLIKIRTSTSTPPPTSLGDKVIKNLDKLKINDNNSTTIKGPNRDPIFATFPFRLQDKYYKGAGCFRCHKTLVGKYTVTVNNKVYHLECFICYVCGTQLKIHYEKDGNYYCKNDYGIYISPKCQACSKPCFGKWTIIEDKCFHYECFICCICGVKLGTHFEKYGKYYCVEDHGKIFAPKCSTCQKPCVEKHTVMANKVYHFECFVCCICGVKLETHYEKNGKYYCVEDHGKIFGPKCSKCKKPCVEKHTVVANKVYHFECFVCCICGVKLDTHYTKNGKYYCVEDYGKIFVQNV